MQARSVWSSLVTLAVLAPSTLAHEGHGHSAGGGTFLHYLLEPVHLPLTCVVLGGGALLLRRILGGRHATERSVRSLPQGADE